MATVHGLLISVQNVGTYLPNDTLSHLKSLEVSKSLLKRSWVLYVTLLAILWSVTGSTQD